jgi:hypothetical protein
MFLSFLFFVWLGSTPFSYWLATVIPEHSGMAKLKPNPKIQLSPMSWRFNARLDIQVLSTWKAG